MSKLTDFLLARIAEDEGAAFEITFHEEPPAELLETDAGAGTGWMYVWDGKPGRAVAVPYALVSDGEGGGFLEPTGPAQEVMIVDDTDQLPG